MNHHRSVSPVFQKTINWSLEKIEPLLLIKYLRCKQDNKMYMRAVLKILCLDVSKAIMRQSLLMDKQEVARLILWEVDTLLASQMKN